MESIENSFLARKEFLERHDISTSISASRNRRPRQEDLMKKWRVEALEMFKTEFPWPPERERRPQRLPRTCTTEETERAIDMRVFSHTDLVNKACAVGRAHYKALEYMLEKFSEYHIVNASEILKVIIEVYAELCRTALPDGKPAQISKLAPLISYLTKQAAEEGWMT